MRTPRPFPRTLCTLLCAVIPPARAETALPAALRPDVAEAVQLSPFQVIAEDNRSYQAANTLGATRTNVAIRDLPMQINVVTEQLMVDHALFDLNQVLDFLPGTARSYDEFMPLANLRGFVSLGAMRNGVRTVTTPDLTSVARVEAVKGPAALIYGWTQPGGVLNYITKNPSSTRRARVRASAGSDGLRRVELDATGPINARRTFNYRVGLTRHAAENGERERSLDRMVIAPMLQWKPVPDTSITARFSYTHDDIRPAEGLVLKPNGAVNRGGDPSYFYRFNGLDAPRNPQWVTSVGPDFIRDSPSSFRDLRTAIWELEATRRLNCAMDLRFNFAQHRRARSSIRESGTALLNPWIQAATIAQLDGYNGWNLDHTRGDPFPEARFTYGFVGRGGNPDLGDPLADTRLINGQPYVYDPHVRMLQYVDGVTGWRRVTWEGSDRRERRINGQIDLVTRFATGPLQHTLLIGFEHNEDRRWDNFSVLLRDPALALASSYTIPGTNVKVPNTVDYTYNIFDPVSIAARDAFARRNLPPLARFTGRDITDRRTTTNALYANLSATFLGHRGRLSLGGRYDDMSASSTTKNDGTNPIGFGGAVTDVQAAKRSRGTPQAGLSFRIADPVTLYALYSQSLHPFVGLQPARTSNREKALLDRYRQDGLPAPNLDTLPWGQLRDPQVGVSYEFGIKTELFANKAMVNIGFFTIDKENISRTKPDTDPDSVVGFVDFTGVERARGVDVDFYARPWRGLQLGGGGLYNRTEIVAANSRTLFEPLAVASGANNGPSVTYSPVGQRLPDAPKWSGNGYVRYEFQKGATKGLRIGANYVYVGARREGTDVLRWSEAWSRWDVNASRETTLWRRRTTFGLVVRNATNRIYRVDRDIFAPRRQFIGSVDFEF
jgi:outer membrane receptor protein involved in Fe transport